MLPTRKGFADGFDDVQRFLPLRARRQALSGVERVFFALGGVSAFLGVALGAFGAHTLKSRLSPELLATF